MGPVCRGLRGTAMGAEPPPAAGVHPPTAVWPRLLAAVAGLRLPARVAATGRGASRRRRSQPPVRSATREATRPRPAPPPGRPRPPPPPARSSAGWGGRAPACSSAGEAAPPARSTAGRPRTLGPLLRGGGRRPSSRPDLGREEGREQEGREARPRKRWEI